MMYKEGRVYLWPWLNIRGISELFINTVIAGETGGVLDKVLSRLSQMLADDLEMQTNISQRCVIDNGSNSIIYCCFCLIGICHPAICQDLHRYESSVAPAHADNDTYK